MTFEAEGLFFNGSLFPAQYGQNLDLIFHYGIVDIFRSVFLCLGVHQKCSSKVRSIIKFQFSTQMSSALFHSLEIQFSLSDSLMCLYKVEL